MLLAWIKQNDENFAKEFKEYICSEEKDIAGKEEKKE